jgi:transposase
MKYTQHTFTDNEIKLLYEYRDKQKDGRLKVRFIAILFIAKGSDITIVGSAVGKNIKTVENWYNQYLVKGIDSLNSFQYKPKEAFINKEQTDKLVSWVRDTNPSIIKEVKQYIKDNFNVQYSIEGIRVILKKNGLKVLRPKVIPGNPPTEEEQRDTIEKYFEMKESCEKGTVFLFGDGMHLIHQNIPALCWGDPKSHPIIKTNTGRKRLNILGAYNPDSKEFVHLTGEENCDAKRVIEFFKVIIAAYRSAPLIILILDNAKYFKAKIVTEWLENHPQLKIEFLPPYAPNLNLIERFWRFVKGKLVKNRYYEKYKTFRSTVFQFLNHVDEYVDEYKTLMVENFEIIRINA